MAIPTFWRTRLAGCFKEEMRPNEHGFPRAVKCEATLRQVQLHEAGICASAAEVQHIINPTTLKSSKETRNEQLLTSRRQDVRLPLSSSSNLILFLLRVTKFRDSAQ